MTDAASGAYRVLARKYRPVTFADLIGQEAIVRTLANAFATGRIAHAYMLTGVRGVGKTTTARLIARALNYPDGPTVDLKEFGPHCQAILESRHMDVIEMDAASNTGVDNMREIIESVRYAPVSARMKVYIIDEVHMLSKSAFNALLKTLEEPPPHVKFIFATTEVRKVPVTILSRCQRFDLKRLDAALLFEHFKLIVEKEHVTAEDEALKLIARASEGSVRDGLSLLDQAIAYGDGYVKAADVYAMPPHVGRGGWTWYTGSAAWLYRILNEWIIGVRPEWDGLKIDPCVPKDWTEFFVKRIYRGKTLRIQFKRDKTLPENTVRLYQNNQLLETSYIKISKEKSKNSMHHSPLLITAFFN